jgi:hypothetical protein
MNKYLVIGILGLFLVGSIVVYNDYAIPQLIPEDYNCQEHQGFISESSPFFFESSQHYINRKNYAIQKQIEEVCGLDG